MVIEPKLPYHDYLTINLKIFPFEMYKSMGTPEKVEIHREKFTRNLLAWNKSDSRISRVINN